MELADADRANAAVNTVLERRSIRNGYADRSVSVDLLLTIVRCGLAAPSSKNAAPWRLHVVTDRSLIADLAMAVREAPGQGDYVPHDPRTGQPWPQFESTVLESADVLAQVPVAIFVEN